MLDCADKEQNKNEEKKRQRKIRRMPNQLKQTNKLERRESIKWSCWQKKDTEKWRVSKRGRQKQEGKWSTETPKEPTFHVETHSGESYLAVRAGLLEDSVMNERQNIIKNLLHAVLH